MRGCIFFKGILMIFYGDRLVIFFFFYEIEREKEREAGCGKYGVLELAMLALRK